MTQILICGAETHAARSLLDALADEKIATSALCLIPSSETKTRSVTYGDDEVKFTHPDHVTFEKSATLYNFANNSSLLKAAHAQGVKIYDMTGTLMGRAGAELRLMPDSSAAQVTALPSPISTMIASALGTLSDKIITRVVVSTYQGVSGVGTEAMNELFAQSKSIFMNMPIKTESFQKQIAFNALPHVGDFMDGDATTEEWRCLSELKQLLGAKIKVAVNAVHIPVFSGDAAMVNVSFADEITAEEARKLWDARDDISVIDLQSEMEYVTPLEIQGEDSLYISRVREDFSVENGLSFWCVADSNRYRARKILNLSAKDKLIKLAP